jgi:hypothetical protein
MVEKDISMKTLFFSWRQAHKRTSELRGTGIPLISRMIGGDEKRTHIY